MVDITYEKYNHHTSNLALIVQEALKLFVIRQTDFLKKASGSFLIDPKAVSIVQLNILI